MSQVILPRAGILAFMDDESREQLINYGRLLNTDPGEIVIKEGETNTDLYIVLLGLYEVTTRGLGNEVHLDNLKVGDCVGEIAIFHPDVASATVKCVQAGQLWMIEAQSLQEFLLEWPAGGCAAILGIDILLSRRLKRANEIIKSNEIVPAFLSVRSKSATRKLPLPPSGTNRA